MNEAGKIFFDFLSGSMATLLNGSIDSGIHLTGKESRKGKCKH
jgi:hypothetical protein